MDDLTPLTALGHDYHHGDGAAGNQLFEESRPRLMELATQKLRRHPRVRRWVDADDLVQYVSMDLVTILREKPLTNTASFYRLAIRIMQFRVIDRARQFYGPDGIGANHESVGNLANAIEILNGICHDPDVRDWTRLLMAVDSLPPDEHEAFSLTYYYEWSQTEIADVFDVDVRTIRRWLESAKSRLRERLGDDYA